MRCAPGLTRPGLRGHARSVAAAVTAPSSNDHALHRAPTPGHSALVFLTLELLTDVTDCPFLLCAREAIGRKPRLFI